MDSYIQSYDPDWYGVINSNDAGNSKEKIFILGSSNVYSINATKINEQLTNQEKNFLVYNLADMGDTPAKRISSIDNIISHKPKLVLYGIGLWEFEKFTPVSYSVIDFLVEPSKFFIFLFEDSTNSSIREYIPGSPKDRSLLSLNHILRGPDPHFHPFIKFYPTPINNLEKLEQNFDLPTYNGLELTNKNKKIVALNKMLKKFNDNEIRVILFSNPQHKFVIDATNASELVLFEKTLIKKSTEFEIPIYFLHDKYMDMNIWRDFFHISIHPNAEIYTDDISRIIFEELRNNAV